MSSSVFFMNQSFKLWTSDASFSSMKISNVILRYKTMLRECTWKFTPNDKYIYIYIYKKDVICQH